MNGVNVICPNYRRCHVKLSAATHLRKVLEEACLMQGYDVDSHELKYQNRRVDLSLPFRLSGLPNNVTLEMTPLEDGDKAPPLSDTAHSTGSVEIALQLSDGARQLMKFENSASLLEILEKFSGKFEKNLTKCDGGGQMEGGGGVLVPVCVYMNREYRGVEMMAQTTLISMGIAGGRALIRHNFAEISNAEQLEMRRKIVEEEERREKLSEGFEQRKAENEARRVLERQREEQYKKEQLKQQLESERLTSLTVVSQRPATPPSTPEPIPQIQEHSYLAHLHGISGQVVSSLETNIEPQQQHAENVGVGSLLNTESINYNMDNDINMDIDRELQQTTVMESTVEEEVKCDDRKAILIRNEDINGENDSNDIENSFFDITLQDVQLLQRDLKQQLLEQEERALIPREVLERKNRELREAAYKNTVIRFKLPDGTIIQANFMSKERVPRIFEFIEELLLDKSKEFGLYLALSQKLKNDKNKNLFDSSLVPTCTIFVRFRESCEDYVGLFSENLLKSATWEQANAASKQWLSENGIFKEYKPQINPAQSRPESARRDYSSSIPTSRPQFSNPCSSAPKWFKRM